MSRDGNNNLIPSTSPSVFSVEGLVVQGMQALAAAIGKEIISEHGQKVVGAALEFVNRHARRLLVDDSANIPPTPLIHAVSAGDTNKMADLIKDGTDINQRDYFGRTALFFVKNEGAASILIANNIDFNLVDNNAQNAVEYLTEHSDVKGLGASIKTLISILRPEREDQSDSVLAGKIIGGVLGGSAGLLVAATAMLNIVSKCRRMRQEAQREREYQESPLGQMIVQLNDDIRMEEIDEALAVSDLAMERGIDPENIPEDELSQLINEVRFPKQEAVRDDSSTKNNPNSSTATSNITTIQVAPKTREDGEKTTDRLI